MSKRASSTYNFDKTKVTFSHYMDTIPPEERAQVEDFTLRVMERILHSTNALEDTDILEQLAEHPYWLDAHATYPELGVEVSTWDKIPLTALAILHDQRHFVRPLAAAGADINATSTFGYNALSLALVRPKPSLNDFPLAQCDLQQKLHFQKDNNFPETLSSLDYLITNNYHKILRDCAAGGANINPICPANDTIPYAHSYVEQLIERQKLRAHEHLPAFFQVDGPYNKKLGSGDYFIHALLEQTDDRQKESALRRCIDAGLTLTPLLAQESQTLFTEQPTVSAQLDTAIADAQQQWDAWRQHPNPQELDVTTLLRFSNIGHLQDSFTIGHWRSREQANAGLALIDQLPPFLQSELELVRTNLQRHATTSWQERTKQNPWGQER